MKAKQNISGIVLATVLLTLAYGFLIEPYQFEVGHVWFENTQLNKILKDKIAVHISDIHINKIGKREKTVLRLIDELKPDLIFLTGDYIKWDGNYEPALTFFSNLKAKIGVWAVMGDYDYRVSRKSCLFCHDPGSKQPTQRHGVRFLRNSVEKISLPRGYVWIGGIDEGFNEPITSGETLQLVAKNSTGFILSHNPLVFDSLDDDLDVIMLAGDTHGGQIPLPSWIWKLLGYEKNARYNQGYFQDGKKKMYVSRGIGTSHLPIRIFRRPEVVVLHF
jgi:predicted MPP superfamily phosphohydrolase